MSHIRTIQKVVEVKESKSKWILSMINSNSLQNPMLYCQVCKSFNIVSQQLDHYIEETVEVFCGILPKDESNELFIESLNEMKMKMSNIGKLWELYVKNKQWTICLNRFEYA